MDNCKNCNSTNIFKNGKRGNPKRQSWKCKSCNLCFLEDSLGKYDKEKIKDILKKNRKKNIKHFQKLCKQVDLDFTYKYYKRNGEKIRLQKENTKEESEEVKKRSKFLRKNSCFKKTREECSKELGYTPSNSYLYYLFKEIKLNS